MAPLDRLRRELDAIDGAILEALAKRRRVIESVIQAKGRGSEAIRDRRREEELLADRVERGRALGLDGYFVTQLFRHLLRHSVRTQNEHLARDPNEDRAGEVFSIGYQGSEGAYSHRAAQEHFACRLDRSVFRGFRTFREMLDAVVDGNLNAALLPIENTTAGSINEAYELLNRLPIAVVGEEVLLVEHCLVALEDVPLAHIRRIYSHPMAIAQCSDFLASLADCKVESYADTAMAVELIRDAGDASQAAIASEEAARLHGLAVLKRDIANRRENFTRFVVIAREPIAYDLRIPCKTSLILATRHVEGALLRCLNVLAAHHLNLTKLESRPRPNVPWEYLFYIDFEGNVTDPNVKEALDALTREVSFLKVLGSYPAQTTEAARPASPRRLPSRSRRGGEGTASAEPTSSGVAPEPPDGAGKRERPKPQALEVAEKKGYKLASRAHRAEDTLVKVSDVTIGGPEFLVIAGPCSVESWEQVRTCAKVVREHGGQILRGGVFKPRTSTYSFQGLGFNGLELLSRAGREFGLPIVTEVMHPADVERVAAEAHMLQIGARNMQNFSLLKEAGRVDRPVLLKRGPMASIDELLAASEYLLAAGNQQVVLCERGIRTFETATRFTLDVSAVPVLRERTHLPVIVDPSHAAGTWRYVIPLAEAAAAAGAHGIIVEIHPDPATALSDGPQALTFERFAELMERLHRLMNVRT
jgi:chorismate mutase/prephenate dehydratase